MICGAIKFLFWFSIFIVVFFGLATCASNADLQECKDRASHLHTEGSYYKGRCYLKGFGV